MYVNSCKGRMNEKSNSAYTRSKKSVNLQCPFPRSEFFRKSISYQGPSRWAKLPHEIKNIASLDQFMVAVKEYFWNRFLEDQIT